MKGNHYTKLIAKALKVEVSGATIKMLDQVEDFMRNDIFHSTLDWQTTAQFNKGAREGKAMWDYLQTAEGKAEFGAIAA